MRSLRILVDIDGVLCEEGRSESIDSLGTRRAIIANVSAVNELFELGHTIIIFTGRKGMEQEVVTILWLARHGVKYHEIHFGKPKADIYVDDRAVPSLERVAFLLGKIGVDDAKA